MNREQKRKAMRGYQKMLKGLRKQGLIPMPGARTTESLEFGDKVTMEMYPGKTFVITPIFEEWVGQ